MSNGKIIDRQAVPTIVMEQKWLALCIAQRLATNENTDKENTIGNLLPVLDACDDEYARLIKKHRFNPEERLLLALALCNHYDPRMLNDLMSTPLLQMKCRALKTVNGLSVLPTAETFFYLVAGNNSEDYIRLHGYFSTGHPFYRDSILDLGDSVNGASRFDGGLNISITYRDLLLYNQYQPPRFSSEFPAHLLSTKLTWDDLVLMPQTQNLLGEMKNRLIYEATIRNWETPRGKLDDHMRPGMRVLLYGASGQGKTLTTALFGKLLKRDVYRIDLSSIISKYVGETSRNLRTLFDTAERKDWIIFIDEGDALLGMRSDLSSNQSSTAHNNNQDVAYILQRIETFHGIVFVATNLASNIDPAFERRFEGRIQYLALSADKQRQVWENVWPNRLKTDNANITALLTEYPLSPASIVNVVQRIAILMAHKQEETVANEMIRRCIMDEALKYKGR
jgi:hypothetical protein